MWLNMFFAFVCLIGFPENPSHFQARLKLPGLIGFSKIFFDSVKYRCLKMGCPFWPPKILYFKEENMAPQFETYPFWILVTDKTAWSTQKIWLVFSIWRWWICHQCCAWATLTSVTWGVPKRTSKEHNKNYLETASWCSLHFPSIIFEGDVQGHHTATTAVAPEAGNSHSNAARWTRNYAIQCFERFWHR